MGRLVQVAVPAPVHGFFDYLWKSEGAVIPGTRVLVPFGRRQLIGLLVAEIFDTDIAEQNLKAVRAVLDESPVLSDEILQLLKWASSYYHHPVGEVITSALPTSLRKGKAAELRKRELFRWIGPQQLSDELDRAKLQLKIARHLIELDGAIASSDSLAVLSPRWRQAVKSLVEKGFVITSQEAEIPENRCREPAPELNMEQQSAVEQINRSFHKFQPFLLNGVTGSGKTEVYIRCIQQARAHGLQSLVLVPEIALTPQLMNRFQRRLNGCLVTLHSALNDSQRLQNWLFASQGNADVVIGTRSSILVPLPRLGLIIVDEEHDGSLKQQEGFRYHARDMALKRAHTAQCPVVLGSATPSFESLNNVQTKRYSELPLLQRAGQSIPPSLGLLDIRRRKLVEGISDRLIESIAQHLENDGQSLIFINRRGFAPTLLCNDCGAASQCRRCDANMTVHAKHALLRCHHCGAERALTAACESCQSDNLDFVGYGTERITRALEQYFPGVPIARIDRDSTRRKGTLEEQLDRAASGEAKLLVGTQMLAKGHHFPKLTLVGILDADRGLYGSDFRSLEHMGQLIVQVAGRAGRETQKGTVLIQTRNPDNAMLNKLVTEGYAAFAEAAMDDRRQAALPPFSFVALVRAEAADIRQPIAFLQQVSQALIAHKNDQLQVLGPAPAPMERLGGRYRAQLLVQSDKRSVLNSHLSYLCGVIDELEGARRCRWSIDVDPVDLY